MKLRDIGEFGFIDRVAPLGNIRSEGVVKGIGDDCAVVSVGGPDHLLVTTDLLIERVHFLLEWASPQIFGAKSLAVNLSDIAACGGRPLDAFISLAIPDRVDLEWLDGFYAGMSDLARQYSVNLLGGDTSSSKSDLIINVAVTGRVSREEVLFRHTANPGDLIVITGPLGESAAGLDILLQSGPIAEEWQRLLVTAHLGTKPHLEEGRLLATSGGCTAAIDVSDGLSSDLRHLCEDSGVAAVVYEDKIPVSKPLARAAALMGREPLDYILGGGEDYVLLAALKPAAAEDILRHASHRGMHFFPIGEFIEGQGMELVRRDGTKHAFIPGGWDHFR